MIGGVDVVLPTRLGRQGLEVAARVVRHVWRHATFENASNGARFPGFAAIPFGRVDELFVFRDPAAADGWDRDGATPALCNTMIHLLSDDDRLTLVVDQRDEKMEVMIRAVSSALAAGMFQVPAGSREAA